VLAQGLEARMHLGRHGSRHRARRPLRRPQPGLGMGVRQVFEDRQGIPYHQAAGVRIVHHQCRHLAGGRVTLDLRLGVGRTQIDVDLAEGDFSLPHGRKLQLEVVLLPITSL
jgi:hypothetical protein